MMVGEPIILLSHGLKANTEDCRLLDDLACAPITDLSDDVFFDSAELEKVTGIDPYEEEHLARQEQNKVHTTPERGPRSRLA